MLRKKCGDEMSNSFFVGFVQWGFVFLVLVFCYRQDIVGLLGLIAFFLVANTPIKALEQEEKKEANK